MKSRCALSSVNLVLALSFTAMAQTSAANATNANTSFIDDAGRAHVTRVVRVPGTVSPEAQAFIGRHESDAPDTSDVAQQRANVDKWQNWAGEQAKKIWPATVTPGEIAGVPVRIVMPPAIAKGKENRVLLNLHGGGFVVDSGSLTETIPIANLTQTKVVAVLYRRSPENPFPAALDDAIAVYKELLKTYEPRNIAIYGSSAGAILTTEVAAKIKQLALPMPAALGVFSGMGDFSKPADSARIYGLDGLSGHLDLPVGQEPILPEYVAKTDPKDPILSPIYSDLHGMPPTLFITSTRDLVLSGTVIMHRAFLGAGAKAELVVFEALPHTFWNVLNLPETKEANQIMANFFNDHLGNQSSIKN